MPSSGIGGIALSGLCAGRPANAQQRVALRKMSDRRPYLTQALIAVNVLVFVATSANRSLEVDLGVFAAAVSIGGEWWRILTSGFLHFNIAHIGFNSMLLYLLGRMLEPTLGPLRFAGVYLAGLIGGSAGALLIEPNALTGGASGAVLGLAGAAMVAQRMQGVDVWRGGIGPLVAVNLLWTFLMPGVSIGGHLGGLIGGAIAGGLVELQEKAKLPDVVGAALLASFSVALFGAALLIAG